MQFLEKCDVLGQAPLVWLIQGVVAVSNGSISVCSSVSQFHPKTEADPVSKMLAFQPETMDSVQHFSHDYACTISESFQAG